MPINPIYFVDSSVLLRACVDESLAAGNWLNDRIANEETLAGSKLLRLETIRVIKNSRMGAEAKIMAEEFLQAFVLISLTDSILDDAEAMRQEIGGADAIHVATALSLGKDGICLVTHDEQMAHAAQALGLAVVDPVTDDPKRSPVA